MKKYPRVPHLPGSNFSEDDISAMDFPEGDFYVFEKLDGANLGISMSESNTLKLQNRGSYLENKRSHPQWDAAKNWSYSMYEVFSALFTNLPKNSVIFGEWLYAKHSIHYTKLESLFVVYDIYVGHETFLPYFEAKLRATEVGLYFTPLITSTSNVENFLLSYNHTPFYSEECEGFIFRNVKNYSEAYKFVNPGFTAGITSHWFDSGLVKNNLKV